MIPVIERLSVVCAWPDERAHLSPGNMPDIDGDPYKVIQTHLTPCAVQIKGKKKRKTKPMVHELPPQRQNEPLVSVKKPGKERMVSWSLAVLAFPISINWPLFAKPVFPLLSDSSPCFHVCIFLLPYFGHLHPFLIPPAQKPDTFSKKIKHCLEATFLLPLQLQRCIQPLLLMFSSSSS